MLPNLKLHMITQKQILFLDNIVACRSPVVCLWLILMRYVFRPALVREQHYQYLKKGLRHLSDAYEVQYHKNWANWTKSREKNGDIFIPT